MACKTAAPVSALLGLTASSPHIRTRTALSALALASTVLLASCSTTSQTTDLIAVDRAQGSEENIASLTSVINANPSDPEGYNVRGSAYGRAGQFNQALDDFNRAIQINPQFYQA